MVKKADPQALTVSESWQKDSSLLRMLRGDRLDTTMNYRLRDAVIGLLTPGTFDSKGFGDSGYQTTVSQFANRLASTREDYPDAAYYSLMNLLDSHDTERLRWTLTPGVETTVGRERNGFERGRRQAPREARFADPVHRPRRSDDLLRRRGRDDRGRRPGRPTDVPVGRYGRFARHGHARPLHGARGVARQGQGTDRRRFPHLVRERRDPDCRLWPAKRRLDRDRRPQPLRR